MTWKHQRFLNFALLSDISVVSDVQILCFGEQIVSIFFPVFGVVCLDNLQV